MVVQGKGIRPIWTFLSPREQLIAGDVKEIKRQGGVRQMFWAAFGAERWTGLMALDSRVNGQHIINLYSAMFPQ